MSLAGPVRDILYFLNVQVEENLDRGWGAEPPAARLALLVRDGLERWTRTAYPGSACEGTALEKGSRRRLRLTIHSAPATHRVEIWGLSCGDAGEAEIPVGEHVAHSWGILAHLGPPCPALDAVARRIAQAGLREVDRRDTPRLSLSLWAGVAAPEGCPDCQDAPHP